MTCVQSKPRRAGPRSIDTLRSCVEVELNPVPVCTAIDRDKNVAVVDSGIVAVAVERRIVRPSGPSM